VWTKFVRAAVPILGKENTKDAALFETAYFADNALIRTNGTWNGVAGLKDSMMRDNPTTMSVWPACPNAWMHPGIA
jgi:hypothetical protein